jgi:hypothetical protein
MKKVWHFALAAIATFVGRDYCAISAVANLFPTLVIFTLTF